MARAAESGTAGDDAGIFLMAVVLIVEDDPSVRESVEWLISEMGHDTLLAGNTESALAHLSGPGPVDLLFVDIRLDAQVNGGCDVAEQAIAIRPDLRVLYTSGKPLAPETAAQFVAGGQFIEKPYSFDQLQQTINGLLH